VEAAGATNRAVLRRNGGSAIEKHARHLFPGQVVEVRRSVGFNAGDQLLIEALVAEGCNRAALTKAQSGLQRL